MTETALREIGERHGFSEEAVRVVARELSRGNGMLAQFDHDELGGRGQWMPGMVQIGQMNDARLKARVAALLEELSAAVDGATADIRSMNDLKEREMMKQQMEATKPMKPLSPMKPMAPMKPMRPMQAMKPLPAMKSIEPWWPAKLGDSPDAAGGQNGVRYAYFRLRHRLVVDVEGYVATYDTTSHVITGIAQAQSDDLSHLVFSAEDGPVPLESLRAVSEDE